MNYMKEVAKMLGVEIGEEFKIEFKIDGTSSDIKYSLTENGLIYTYKNNVFKSDGSLESILLGDYQIIKLPKPILDDVEKKYLSRVIRPWRDKVEYIRKINFDDEDEFIVIIYRERESKAIPLPCFKKGTMYKGMEVGKEYSLEDLGL